MTTAHKPEYLRTHRLRGKVLAFLLPAEEDEILLRARTAKTGRAARTLIKEGAMRATLAALSRGTSLAPHHVDGTTSIQTLRGGIRVIIADDELEVPQGGLVVLHSGLKHSARATEDSVLLITVAMDRLEDAGAWR